MKRNGRVPIYSTRRGCFGGALCQAGRGADHVTMVEDVVATLDGAAALVAVAASYAAFGQVTCSESARNGALLVIHEILRKRAVGRLDLYLQLLQSTFNLFCYEINTFRLYCVVY